MSLASDKEMAVARVYALALLALAHEQGKAEEVLGELAAFSRAAQTNPAVGRFLSDPTVEVRFREAALEKMLRGKLSSLTLNALLVMNRKGRVSIIPHFAEAYRQALGELHGEVDVAVTTAVSLTPPQKDKLRSWAASFTGGTPVLMETVTPEILGGVVVQIGDDKFDMSVSRGLRKMRNQLMSRASQEIYRGRVPLEQAKR